MVSGAKLQGATRLTMATIAGYAADCSMEQQGLLKGVPQTGGDNVMLEPIGLITLLVVGAVAGWLAGQIVRGYGFGLIGNIVVGIIGAFIGAWLVNRFGILGGGGMISWIISATIGAVILLFVVGLIKR